MGVPKGSDKFKKAWAVAYTDADGKRRQEQFKSKKAADKRRLAIELELELGVHTVASATVTVGELLDAWLADCERRHRIADNMAGYTLVSYRQQVENHLRPALGGIRLSKLTSERCQELVNDLADKYKATPERVAAILKLALNFAVKPKKWLKRNPLRDESLRIPKRSREIPVPTLEDLRGLLESVEVRHDGEHVSGHETRRAFIVLAIYTGLRKGEIAGLQWEHLDFVNGVIEVRHSLSSTGHVFVTRTGKPIGVNAFYQGYFLPAMRYAGLVDDRGKAKHSIHALRHAFASLLQARGVAITDAAKLMGHSKETMTLRYTHSLEDRSKWAVEGVRAALAAPSRTDARPTHESPCMIGAQSSDISAG